RLWHQRWLAESLGFGLAALFVFLVPFANLLLGPALAIGGTLLVLDLEPERVAESAPPAPPVEPAPPAPVEAPLSRAASAGLRAEPVRHHERPPRERRRQRLVAVVRGEDGRLPGHQVGVRARERLEARVRALALSLHPLADEEQVGPRDRLVIEPCL